MWNENESIVELAEEFLEDLTKLHPLRKLASSEENKYTRSRLPNLSAVQSDFAEDLELSIRELFQSSICKKSRLHFFAST